MMSKTFIHPISHGSILKRRSLFNRFHIDPVLFFTLISICMIGLFILYSASDRNMNIVGRQAIYMGIGLVCTLLLAQISPARLQHWMPFLYVFGIILLLVVLVAGKGVKGATRWIALPGFRFQPSELLKLVVPLTVASYLNKFPLPCGNKQIFIVLLITVIPAILVAKQPDLGTAVLIAFSGMFILFMAGFHLRYIFILLLLAIPAYWVMWHFIMHDYQKQRVLTFINPERDPLRTGWHIIQAKIAIGSGGVYGKGYLHGSQSHLNFLPEGHTDFIFAVLAEEFGLIGICMLLLIYTLLIGRGFYIAMTSHSIFSRLVAGGIVLTFSFYIIINIGMVCGLLPVVGVPLPLISRGGTSVVSLMAGFGILMSIHTHKFIISE